jgi:hypothetical protein
MQTESAQATFISIGRKTLAYIATLFAAMALHGCEWFEDTGDTDQNPFQTEPLEINTVHAPRVSLDGNGFATVMVQEQQSRGAPAAVTNGLVTVRALRHELATGAVVGSSLADGRLLLDHYPNTALVGDTSATTAFFSAANAGRCRFAAAQGWNCEAHTGQTIAAAGDGAGRVLAIQVIGDSLNARAYTPGVGWGADRLLLANRLQPTSPTTDRDERRMLAYWSGGVGFATWLDSGSAVYAARYLRDSDTWETPQALGVSDDFTSDGNLMPVLALARHAPNAGAIVVWSGPDGELQFSRYVPGSGWQSAQFIAHTRAPNRMRGFDLDMSDNGDVLMIGIDMQTRTVRSLRYRNGAWEAPQTVGTVRDDDATRPRIVMDGAGNGMAVWYDGEPQSLTSPANMPRLFINRFSATQGWRGAEQIGQSAAPYNGTVETGTTVGSAGANDVEVFDVDMDPAGRAMVAWIGQPPASAYPTASRLRTFVTGLFNLAITPSLTVPRNGGNAAASISIQRNAFPGDVNLEVLDCPARVICTLGRTVMPGDVSATTLTFFTNSEQPATAGDYDIRVRAVGAAQTSEGVIRVTFAGGEPPFSDVTLTMNVTAGGRVISTPAGLDCLGPQTCNATFARNQSVTLSTTASPGQVFAGFGGDPDCSDGTLVLSANAACVATFVTAAGQWSTQGNALNVSSVTTAAYLNTPEIEIGLDGLPVAAFIEGESVVVRRFNGTDWQTLGEPVNVRAANSVSLTIGSAGAPTIAWEESDPQNNDASRSVFAARWSGSAWARLGVGPVDIEDLADAHSPCIRARSNDLVMTWVETSAQTGSRVVVRTWDGIAWSNAGTTEGPPSTADFDNQTPKLAVGSNDALAIGWADGLIVHVAELIGGVWTLTPMPLPMSTGGSQYMLDVAYSNAEGLLFAAAQNNGTAFTVRRWRNNAWSDFGSARGNTDLPGGNARIFGLAFSHGRNGSTPLLAYSRRNFAGSVHEFIVDRYSGSDWTRLGNPIAPLSRHNRPGFELYVAVADGAIPRVATQVIDSLPTTIERDDSLRVYRFQ